VSGDIGGVLGMFSGVVGGVVVALFNYALGHRQRAKLQFSPELLFQNLGESLRVLLEVRHVEGSLPAEGAIGYLTVTVDGSPSIPSRLVVPKQDGSCKCPFDQEGASWRCEKKYLAPSKSPMVRGEPLPWTTPTDWGRGLDGLPYKHVMHIPAKGVGKLALLDLYKVTEIDDNGHARGGFFLLRIHSEYGTEVYPRVCLKLPISGGRGFRQISLEVAVAGGNMRGRCAAVVRVKPAEGDFYLEYAGRRWMLGRLLKEKGVRGVSWVQPWVLWP